MRTLVAIEQNSKIEGRVREMAQVLLGIVRRMGLLAGDIREVHRQPLCQVPSAPRPLEHLQPTSARPHPPPIQRSALHPPSTLQTLALPRLSPIPGAWPASGSASVSSPTRLESTSQVVPIMRKKSVRFSSKKVVQEVNGQERKEIVTDNEGKTRRKKKGQDASGN